ncbi:MAG: hypothetical protein MI919_15400, partial [Holophagales bacterium]|nr:hypothetical protein [Holophagales bacterium]
MPGPWRVALVLPILASAACTRVETAAEPPLRPAPELGPAVSGDDTAADGSGSTRFSVEAAELRIEGGRLVAPLLVDGVAARRVATEAHELRRTGREGEALALLARAHGQHGLDARGYALLAALLEHEGELQLALAARRSALVEAPSAERHRQLAALLSRAARRQEALDAWRVAVDADPSHAPSRGRLAVAQHFAGVEVDPDLLADAPEALRGRLAADGPAIADVRTARLGGGHGIGPETRIDTGGSFEGGEMTMVAWGEQVTVAWNDLRQGGAEGIWRIGVGTTSDGGATWSDQILRHPDPIATAFEGDPMTAFDPRTGSFWAGAIEFFAGGRVYVARKAPGAADFEPPVVVASDSSFDKGWMAAG